MESQIGEVIRLSKEAIGMSVLHNDIKDTIDSRNLVQQSGHITFPAEIDRYKEKSSRFSVIGMAIYLLKIYLFIPSLGTRQATF